MAKMRVHEFAKEIDRQSADVIACLEEFGIEGKKASSSIDEDMQEKVKAKLAGSAAPKKDAPAEEKKENVQAPAQEKNEAAPVPEHTQPHKQPHSPEKAKEGVKKPPQEAPKKKKSNIIFVSNPHNSQAKGREDNSQLRAGNRQNDRRPRQQSTSGRPNTSKLIKPNVPRSQTQLVYQETRMPIKGDQQQNRPRPKQEASAERKEKLGRFEQPSKELHKEDQKSVQRNNVPVRDSSGSTRDNNRNNQNRSGGRNEKPDRNVRFGTKSTEQPADFSRDNRGAKEQTDTSRKNENDKRRQNQDRHKKDQSFMNEDGFKGGKQVKGSKSRLERPQEKKQDVKEEEKIKVITIPEVITIKELADKMKVQPAAIIKKLFMQGKAVTVNQEISYEQAEEIAVDYDILCEKEVVVDVIEELLKEQEEEESAMVKRPPVICVMGHVDHGKTSLLDAIRSTHVIDKEAGGITQHIGAYVVNTQGRKITFLDTPGHEAFTAMRMRGANSTDIAILVVAADDGVMPQTVEAINHAKAAGIEIIVAVNKIDKPSANIDRVKQELSEYDLISEDWGGSTVFVPVSAKTGEGIDQLLEMILLTADILELKANPKRRARGLVIEAELDKGRGPVATVLVQKGTLRVGDFIACGPCHGKVRAMIDDKGRRVKEAGPSTPVEILGLNDVPGAGEIFVSPENDKEAKNFAETFIAQNKMKLLDDTKSKMSLDDLFNQIQEGSLKELNLIVKADVQGSVEAVKESLIKLSNDEVVVKVIHGGVGAINESDVTLASASNAIIIGFNVRPDATAKGIAETEGVDLRLYSVIYKAIEDVELAMRGMLDPVFEEKVLGHAEIRQIFKASGIGNIAGSYVLDGVFERNCKVRISRAGEQIFEGNLASLKRFKDDVREVKAGYECGLVFEDFGDIAELDIVEAYKMVEVPRK